MPLTFLASRIGRLYPLSSGAGSFANMALFRWLDQSGDADATVTVKGGRARIPGGDHVGRAMRFVGDLDPKVSWVVDRSVSPGDTVLDIGANLGLVSLRLAGRVGPSGQVHAFEPQPRLQSYFEQTLQLNSDAPITLHPVALGAEDAELAMSVPQNNAGAASLVQAGQGQTDAASILVPVRRLTDYAAEMGISKVDFIKMDVEGFEAKVIAGGLGLLEKTRPKVIILEENSLDPETGLSPALEALQNLDYDLFSLPKQLWSVRLFPIESKQLAHDFVAVSRDAPQTLRQALGIAL